MADEKPLYLETCLNYREPIRQVKDPLYDEFKVVLDPKGSRPLLEGEGHVLEAAIYLLGVHYRDWVQSLVTDAESKDES